MQQQQREAAEEQARNAAQTGDAYEALSAEGMRYLSKQDWRRAARTYREAIALRPDRPTAYHNLGAALANSAHDVEAAQRFLEAKERYLVGSKSWAQVTAMAFDFLKRKACAEVAKPEWWNDEGLKALSARVVRVVPDDGVAHEMRALRSSLRRPRTTSGLRRCTLLRRGKPSSPVTRTGAAARSGRLVPHSRARVKPRTRCLEPRTIAGRVPARPEPTHAVLPRLGQAPTGGDAAARGGVRLAVLA
eukprot:scaffold39388_cov48-Phaeocystis_antarctica.AAC.1